MEWLNYHHLLYFWMVAKEGSIVAASQELRLAHPTISGQIHRLEEVLGQKLFVKRGRNLVLTDQGRVAFRYADEIFSLGREFMGVVQGQPTGRVLRLVVGVSDVIAKSIVYRMLEPTFHLEEDIRVVCRDNASLEAFIGELAMHTIDVVLSDAPAGPASSVRAYSHPLGDCGSSFFASPKLARTLRRGFPQSLNGAPMIMPNASSTLRRSLDEWLDANDIRPKIVAEVDDVALGKIFSEQGLGVIVSPSVIEDEVRRRYTVQLVGRVDDLRHRFYVISLQRKIKHPAVAAICETARKHIFA